MPTGKEARLKLYKELFEGLRERDMTHLPQVSMYCTNFYSVNGRLLFARTDAYGEFTRWYWVKGDEVCPIGVSFCSAADEIIVNTAYV